MNTKISFHNMEHSKPLEEHARAKLSKITEVIAQEAHLTPFTIELWLKANTQHPHHRAELHLKTAHFNLHAHDEGTDIYVATDNTIDKMVALVKKEKEKHLDKVRSANKEKNKF